MERNKAARIARRAVWLKTQAGKEYRRRNSTTPSKRACDKRYQRRPEIVTQRAAFDKQRVANIKTFIRESKAKPCIDCLGTYPPCVMDFHHVRGERKFWIGRTRGRSIREVQAEIEKCVLLCANCHRIRHASKEAPVA
jgi:hypothetical protein